MYFKLNSMLWKYTRLLLTLEDYLGLLDFKDIEKIVAIWDEKGLNYIIRDFMGL